MRFAITFTAGVVLHATVFARHREWDRHAANILISSCVLFAATVIAVAVNGNSSWVSSFASASILSAYFVSGLLSSMTVYRLLLHPLRSFPGPIAARTTSLWILKQSVPDLDLYVKMRSLHDRYGDFVRISPRELSICHPDAIADVHGPRSKIRKGEFYDQTYPFHSLQFIRDTKLHKEQRRYWDRAFHSPALRGYMPRLTRHYRITVSIFASHAASREPIDASSAFLDLFFDVISDLTFGESFDTQTTKQPNPIMVEFLSKQQALGFALLNMPLLHLAKNLRMSAKKQKSWEGWYDEALKARSKKTVTTSDIYTYLPQSEVFDGNALREAKLAIVAGADTNAITMSNICYLLCRHPEYQAKLHDELSVSQSILFKDHPYLNGIINEALRLYPPVPSGLQRVTPAEGAVVAGRHIPGHVNVTTPTYALHRDARAFVRPNEFIPERWYSRPDLILRRDAFVPFGYGAYSCAGRPLAMLQLGSVLAMISQRFIIAFAPGQEALCQYFIDHQADCFTLHLEPLPLLFERRGDWNEEACE